MRRTSRIFMPHLGRSVMRVCKPAVLHRMVRMLLGLFFSLAGRVSFTH
jgi:hypothetical protein